MAFSLSSEVIVIPVELSILVLVRCEFWKFMGYDVIEFAKWVLLLAIIPYNVSLLG